MTENCCRHKERTSEEIRSLTSRLRKIEGQVRGLAKMVEENRYCVDIINQTSAVQAALNSFSKELLNSHINSCVIEDIIAGNRDAVNELCDLLNRNLK